MLTRHTDANADISAVYSVLLRKLAKRVSDNSKLQKCSDMELSFPARQRMRKIIVGKNPNPVLIRGPAEPTKLALAIDDAIDKIFSAISLKVIFKSYGMSVTRVYWRAQLVGLGSRKSNSLGSTEKYRVALWDFSNCFRTSVDTTKPLKTPCKALFYCNSDSGKTGGYHQRSLTTGAFLEIFIALHQLASPIMKPTSSGTGGNFVVGLRGKLVFKNHLAGPSVSHSKKKNW